MTKNNHRIYQLLVRQEYDECLELISQELEMDGDSEYATYAQGLIKRQQGKVHESLQIFQKAVASNPHNMTNLKQVGRSLHLLGKSKAALDVYNEAQRLSQDDWEILHNKGLCHMQQEQHDEAIDCFQRANNVQTHESTYAMLSKVHVLREEYRDAIRINEEALQESPESPEFLSTNGLLHLRTGDQHSAFNSLGRSLSYDPRNPRTILAAASIVQEQGDMDAALMKYRIAATQAPDSAHLWNNIGMCFFGKQKYVCAIACLKRALYLGPFEWIISYNLGVVHLSTGQFASAFHYFSTAVNLNPKFAQTYHYMAIALVKLDDWENACNVYERAIEMGDDHLLHLNYAITLHNGGDAGLAKEHLMKFKTMFSKLDEETKNSDPDVPQQYHNLHNQLNRKDMEF